MSKDHVEIIMQLMNSQLFKEYQYQRMKGFSFFLSFTVKSIIIHKCR